MIVIIKELLCFQNSEYDGDLNKMLMFIIKCNSGSPTRAGIDLVFEGVVPSQQVQELFYALMTRERPLVRYGNALGYMIGDYIIYSQDYTDFTDVALTFRVLNLTWSNDLANPNSFKYKGHAQLFCADVSIY